MDETREEAAADLERASAFDKTFTPKMIAHLRLAAHALRAHGPMLDALEAGQRSDHFMATSSDRQAARDLRTRAIALARKVAP